MAAPADLVITGADVYRVDAARSWSDAVAVRGDRIVAVGSAEVRELTGPSTSVLDLPGALVLPGFRYRAVMDNGVTENEMCPVFVATTRDTVRADPEEVEDHRWVDWTSFRASVLDRSRAISVWCLEQVVALPADPLSAPAARPGDLPPAATGSA